MPGLRGLGCSGFRAKPTDAPDHLGGVAVEFSDDAEREKFMLRLEEYFSTRRFTNAADAFDTVKAYVLQMTTKG